MIFISYNQKHFVIQNKILIPIQTGKILSRFSINNMIGDDTGGNISHLNAQYNELTAQYWVWKNYEQIGNPECVGFMHYRRHFMFDDYVKNSSFRWLKKTCCYHLHYIDDRYLNALSEEKINKLIDGGDCVVLKKFDLKELDSSNFREQYGKITKQKIENFDIFWNVVKEKAYGYEKEIKQVEEESYQYLCNMFIMTKELFFRYNEFCFPILEETRKRITVDETDKQACRALGYFGECLLTLFVFKLYNEKKWKIKEVDGVFIYSDKPHKYTYFRYCASKLLKNITFGKLRKKIRKYHNTLAIYKSINKV